jgi:hypothetical protein
MNRADLQRLSGARIREAKILFTAGEYSGAYYLAGYAVECALKACYSKGVRRYDFPDKTRAGKIFTHRLPDLARLANLESDLATATQPGSKLAGSWLLVCNWTEESRYFTWTRDQAEGIIEAITAKGNGVLPWIKLRW